MLRVELRALQAEDFDLDLVGFGELELAELLANDGDYAAHTDEDAVPETPETAVSAPGDLWVLGDHRVICGDSTQLGAIEKVMDGGLADMVFCDPPYGVAYGSSAPTRREREKRRIANDDLGDVAFGEFLRKASVNLPSLRHFRLLLVTASRRREPCKAARRSEARLNGFARATALPGKDRGRRPARSTECPRLRDIERRRAECDPGAL
jgi:hypothetical protein